MRRSCKQAATEAEDLTRERDLTALNYDTRGTEAAGFMSAVRTFVHDLDLSASCLGVS